MALYPIDYKYPLSSKFCSYYLCSRSDVNKLSSAISKHDWSNEKTAGLWDNPNECVISIREYPLNLVGFFKNILNNYPSFEKIKLYNRTWEDVKGYRLQSETENNGFFTKIIHAASFAFPKYNNNYLDYPPYTTYKLYLPYVGTVDISPYITGKNSYQTGGINVYYAIDFNTGECLAFVTWFSNKIANSSNPSEFQNGEVLLAKYNGVIGIDIPLGQTNSYQVNRNMNIQGWKTASETIGATTDLLGTIGDVGVKIATGSFEGIGNDIAEGVSSIADTTTNIVTGYINAGVAHYTSGGTGSSYVERYSPQECYMIVESKESNMLNETYKRYFGLPTHKSMMGWEIGGFATIEGMQITDEDGNITTNEMSMLHSLLQNGCIFG